MHNQTNRQTFNDTVFVRNRQIKTSHEGDILLQILILPDGHSIDSEIKEIS